MGFFIFLCLLAAAFCFVMWRVAISNERMATEGSTVLQQADPVYKEAMMVLNRDLPALFDERRISEDLAQLAATPGVFAKYVERARSRFNKASERAILEHYITLYQTGKNVIVAKTDLERAKNTYKQLGSENEIKRKENEVRLAELEADREKHLLRRDETAQKRSALTKKADELPPKHPDDIHMDEARERRRRNIQWDVEQRIEPELLTLEELDAWRKRRRRAVLSDNGLDPDEQDERLDDIDRAYRREKDRIAKGHDASVFEEDRW